jgi:hypothetical protein
LYHFCTTGVKAAVVVALVDAPDGFSPPAFPAFTTNVYVVDGDNPVNP